MPDSQAGLEALIKIDQHMKICDQRYAEWQKRQDSTVDYLKEITGKIDDMRTEVSEARGAAKMGKAIIAAVSTVAGAIGGITGHMVFK